MNECQVEKKGRWKLDENYKIKLLSLKTHSTALKPTGHATVTNPSESGFPVGCR